MYFADRLVSYSHPAPILSLYSTWQAGIRISRYFLFGKQFKFHMFWELGEATKPLSLFNHFNLSKSTNDFFVVPKKLNGSVQVYL